METLRRLLAQFRTYWAGLSFPRRALIVASAAGIAIAMGAVAYLSASNYVPVYRDLAPDEAGAMRTTLTAQNIPSRLSTDGTAVLVPQERIAEARVALAGAGLPARGGKGYELFDETSLMTTPFVQNVNYQRALQAELSRSIMQLESVQSARVLIARPDPSPFVRDQQQPTASVVIKMKPGAAMSRATAASIVSLVARSVEGLKPENVTVVDSGGRLLSDPHANDRDNLPTPQLEYRRELEAYLASKAEQMLTQHLGPGRAVVQVSADINFQRVKEMQRTYSPDRVARTERQMTSKNTGGGAGGVTGAVSNITRTGGTTATQGGTGTSSQEETIQTDYALSETVRDIEERMGAVTRLTIAALVDLTPQEEGQALISTADAEEVIKQAVGFRSGRDEVKLTNARLTGPIGPPEPDETLTRLARFQAYVGLARNISLALAVVLVVMIISLLALRRRPAPPGAADLRAATAQASPQQAELNRLVMLARTEPDRVAAVFRTLVGAPTS